MLIILLIILTPLGFWHTSGSLNLGLKIKPYNNMQKEKKEKLLNCELWCSSGPQSKIEKSKKKDKYLDLV